MDESADPFSLSPPVRVVLSRGQQSEGEENEGPDESDEKQNLPSGSRPSRSVSSSSRASRSSARGRPTSARPAHERSASIAGEVKRPLSPGSPRSILTSRGGRPLDPGVARLKTPFDVATHLFDLLFVGKGYGSRLKPQASSLNAQETSAVLLPC